jgi:hypothetical protein
MNTADLLLINCEDMRQRDVDYFERKGCYDLALAILLDCLQQLAHDREHALLATRMEHQWLIGCSNHAPVSCQQVLATLGMEPGGRLQQMFQRIALDDPARAIRMLTSPQARHAFRTMGASGATDEEDPQTGEGRDTCAPDKAPGKAPAWRSAAFEPWVAAAEASVDRPPAAARVEALDVLHSTHAARAVHAIDPAALASPELVRHLIQGELFPTENAVAQLPTHEAAQNHPEAEDDSSAYAHSGWRMRAA